MRQRAGEDAAAWGIRKWATVRRVMNRYEVPWSHLVCIQLTTWLEHWYRHKSAQSWRLKAEYDLLWRLRRRANCGPHRLDSRPGFPVRYLSDAIEQLNWANPDKDTSLMEQRAGNLHTVLTRT